MIASLYQQGIDPVSINFLKEADTINRSFFNLKSCYILRQKMLHFAYVCYIFTLKDITFRFYSICCVKSCYISRYKW